MRPTFIVLLVLGFGAMFWMWNEEWEYNKPPAAFEPVTGCTAGAACVEPWSECLPHASYPDGVCSKPCQFSKDCPGEWCCLDPSGEGERGAFRCLPPAQCKTETKS